MTTTKSLVLKSNIKHYRAKLKTIRQLVILITTVLAIHQPPAAFADELTNDTEKLKSAISLRKSNQNQQAIAILEQLLTRHENHKRINIELAINYIKTNDINRSKQL